MDEQEEKLTFWQEHRFLVLIAGTIFISIVLVSISLVIYTNSGAAQLDLSRPGFISVSSQTVNNDKGFGNYSDIGPVNKTTIEQFKTIYDKQAQTTTVVDAFGGDPLNPETLGISEAVAQE